jgi:hypothetical protein
MFTMPTSHATLYIIIHSRNRSGGAAQHGSSSNCTLHQTCYAVAAVLQGVRELHGVILPEWMQEIYEHLESDELQQKLELARNNTGITGRRDCDDFPYKVEILERLHQLPMLSDTVCDVDRERIQTENYEPADGPHQDHHPYKFRAVFRFPADGRSTTDIDFHAGEDKRLVASLAILPGQVSQSMCTTAAAHPTSPIAVQPQSHEAVYCIVGGAWQGSHSAAWCCYM